MSKQINRKGLDELLESTPEMNATARMILMSYARTMQYVEEVQTTWQSQEAIANFAGVSEDTLTQYTKALVSDGFLILVKEEKLGNNKVKRFYALGKGTITNKLLKRRESNKGASNLVPGAKHMKAEDKPLGTTQKPPLGTTQNRSLGRTETNTKSFTKKNTEQPSAGSLADARSLQSSSSKDKRVGPSFIAVDDQHSLISQDEAASLIPSNTEEAASGSNPETCVPKMTLAQRARLAEEERKMRWSRPQVGALAGGDEW